MVVLRESSADMGCGLLTSRLLGLYGPRSVRSPIVSGYVITMYDRNGCSGVGAWFHQLVRNGIWTCPYSPIPAGYRSTTYTATGCGGLGAWLTVKN